MLRNCFRQARALYRNQTVTARHFNRTAIPFSLVYSAKQAADTTGMTTKDSQVEMERN